MKLIALALCILSIHGADSIFKESGNPYEDGSLSNEIKESYLEADNIDGLEVDTLLMYPDRDDTFGVFYFIGGWSGIVPATVYHTFLKKVAAHGFIVVGPWPLSSEEPPEADVAFNALQWARKNVVRYTGKAKPSFDHLAVGAHSAGCNVQMNLIAENKTAAQAFIGLEPFSAELEETVKFRVPGLFLGTELSEYSCSIPGLDFNLFYDKWQCERVLAEVKGIGHCGIMDDEVWEICDVTGRCNTGRRDLLPLYRQFVQGYASAFMMVHVQGSREYSKYYTDRKLMPFELKSFKTDTNC